MLVSVLGLVQTKVFALFLGPEGVGAFGLLIQFVNLVGLLSGLGLQNAAIRHISLLRSKGEASAVSSTIFLILLLSVAASGAVMTVLLIFSSPIARWLIPAGDYHGLLALFAVSLPIMAARNVLLNILLGYKHVRHNATARVIPAAVGALCVYALVRTFDIEGAAAFYLLVTVSGMAVGAFYVRRLFHENGLPGWTAAGLSSPGRPSLSDILGFSLTTQVNEILQLVAGFVLPMMIVWYASTTVNGYFLVFVAFWGYIYLLQNSMYGYFFPLVSEAGTLSKLSEDMNHAIRLQMLLTVPLVAVITFVAPIAVKWIYADSFLAVAQYLPWLGIPAVATVFGSVCGVCILGKGRLREYTVQNVTKAAVPILLSIVLIPRYGLPGAILAFVSGPVVEGAFSYWVVRYRMECKLSRRGAAVVASGALVLAFQYGATLVHAPWLPAAAFATAMCWALVVVVTDEEMYQVVSGLRSRAA